MQTESEGKLNAKCEVQNVVLVQQKSQVRESGEIYYKVILPTVQDDWSKNVHIIFLSD